MIDCPICDGGGGWLIPGTRDWGTCASCKGAGKLSEAENKKLIEAHKSMEAREKKLRARMRAQQPANWVAHTWAASHESQ